MGRLFTLSLLALVVGLPALGVVMSIQKDALVSKPGEIKFADFERA